MKIDRRVFAIKMCWIALAILAIVLSIWGATRPAAGAAETEGFPVWWSPTLELSRLEDLPARLEKDFQPGRWRIVGDPDYGEKRIIDDCASLLDEWMNGGYFWYLGDWQENRPFYSELAVCQAFRRLAQVRPAEESHLKTFELGPQSLDVLPNLFFDYGALGYGGPFDCEILCDAERIDPKGKTWADAAPFPLIETASGENMVLWSRGRGIRVFLLARGDFNFDGIEDVLIKRHFLSERLYDDILVLTRYGADTVMRVLSPRELCLASDGSSLCSERK